ncbi:MAG TPA: hypothetical protein V6D14_22535 [Coleofasciculaceae cyanobacterium]
MYKSRAARDCEAFQRSPLQNSWRFFNHAKLEANYELIATICVSEAARSASLN